nr:EOG090X0A8N [Polyphemus pediculus]
MRKSLISQTLDPSRSTCRGFLWCRVGIFFCLLCTVVYIPLFYTISLREGTEISVTGQSFQWHSNSTRNVAVYVQPENVTAIIPNPGLCGNSSDHHPFLLIVVCSSVGNFEARNAIRQTWMSFRPNQTAPYNIRMAFLLGQTFNESRQNDVIAESEMHSDIIQEGFHDSYLNLTLKSVMMLKWVTTYCPQVTFVLKTDDDMFVNVPALVHHLAQPAIRHRKDLIVGSLFCRVAPIKDLHSKWYSPQFMFSGKEYPDYVSGTGYVISGGLISTLFENAMQVPLFHLEDIFITGMVARQSNITPENFHLFSYLKQPLNLTCLYQKIFTSHGLKPAELRSIWQRLNDPQLDCSAVRLPKIGDPKTKKCKVNKKVVTRFSARRG